MPQLRRKSMREITYATPQQLNKMRSLPNYRFHIYDESFQESHFRDAEKFLVYGRQMLYASVELADERLLLAKVESNNRAAALYVDRDYFEISLWDEKGHHHVDGWQWPFQVAGHSLDDLEYFMAQCLILGV